MKIFLFPFFFPSKFWHITGIFFDTPGHIIQSGCGTAASQQEAVKDESI